MFLLLKESIFKRISVLKTLSQEGRALGFLNEISSCLKSSMKFRSLLVLSGMTSSMQSHGRYF